MIMQSLPCVMTKILPFQDISGLWLYWVKDLCPQETLPVTMQSLLPQYHHLLTAYYLKMSPHFNSTPCEELCVLENLNNLGTFSF